MFLIFPKLLPFHHPTQNPYISKYTQLFSFYDIREMMRHFANVRSNASKMLRLVSVNSSYSRVLKKVIEITLFGGQVKTDETTNFIEIIKNYDARSNVNISNNF